MNWRSTWCRCCWETGTRLFGDQHVELEWTRVLEGDGGVTHLHYNPGALMELDGQLLRPGDPGYDDARRTWNAMVDRRPELIVRCASVRDVQTAVRAAVEQGLEIGVRCGGHSVLGLGVPDGGLMIDLAPLGAVRVDAGARRAWVQGGALLGALDAAAQEQGSRPRLATSPTLASAGSRSAAGWDG